MTVVTKPCGVAVRTKWSRNTYRRFAPGSVTADAGQYPCCAAGSAIQALRFSGEPPSTGAKHEPVWSTALLETSGALVGMAPEAVTLPMNVSPNIQSVFEADSRTGTAPSAVAHSVYVRRSVSNALW